ncbi:hypothetical protein DICPUDRAFT_155029 [Dictyostelium purpureum]|uniref:Cytidyltransferase-like domain-containing protein n=1 Tax=Dictyostelium purpureum TaxID=5786 RepID=F0ZSW3_DICPU|nr:uncharacterized protein DICPUDRAFT_155029 [Dictyostelium purpureum]EGC32990.1 hypothetical protein DICPUDRAFT_155029 [Dictyostelium purpureum]|eukprot:XP_003290508.1 hypothetical protein DICPUDRAFT_155029 [Dictyostelium purpureum]
MYKTGLIRILFNFQARNKNDLFLHYYNVGKLLSIANKVKDRLYIELINYNNKDFGNHLLSPPNSSPILNSNNNVIKAHKLYNDIFVADSRLFINKDKLMEFDDDKSPSTIVRENIEPLKNLENIFFNYYQILYNANPRLDVSIIPLELLDHNNNSLYSPPNSSPFHHHHLKHIKTPIDVLFVDSLDKEAQAKELGSVNNDRLVRNQIPIKNVETVDQDFFYPKSYFDPSLIGKDIKKWNPPFKGVVLGGTYDRMHPGHKVMLTISSLICSEYMEVGVTDNSILKKKKYSELIEPFEYRSEKTQNFLQSINPNVEYNMLKLVEPYANTMTSKRLECIVISPETFSTAIKINEVRRETNLKPLEIYSISYFDTHHQGEDFKLSSSYLRELDFKAMQKEKEQQTEKEQQK